MCEINDLLCGYQALSIIGMCKNAGKTTAFNRIIEGFYQTEDGLALTSIGRDGESTDRVTGTKKPGIYIREGTMIATAAGMLPSCDITREILMTTGIPTPLGEIVIIRALSDGNVELAGPSIVGQLVQIKQWFLELGAKRVIVDGAISRKTLCSRRLSDATVLCTGASCGKNMEAVVDETRHSCTILTLPEANDSRLEAAAERHPKARFVVQRDDEHIAVSTPQELEDLIKGGGVAKVFIRGAVSEGLAAPIARWGTDIGGIDFVAGDASKIMIGQKTYQRFGIRGARLRVLESVNLAAVTVNPFSAYGYHFDKDKFLAAMKEAIDIPVFDMEAEEFGG